MTPRDADHVIKELGLCVLWTWGQILGASMTTCVLRYLN